MPIEAPFVLIASLRRTGSTLLSDALSQFPHCYVFREPHLAENRLRIKRAELVLFREQGVPLAFYRHLLRIQRRFGRPILATFRSQLLPRLGRVVRQVGVKEIRHARWREYLRYFPEMRVVLTGRDPRDIYLSLASRVRQNKGGWKGELNPETVSAHLLEEFRRQREMYESVETLKVRYEDLCDDSEILLGVKRFIGSSLPEAVEVGKFAEAGPHLLDDYQVHGTQITRLRVARWRQETDPQLSAEAQQTLDRMREYADFWAYS